ncbi:peptidase domain-containing ABC transporter [Alishewanella sp. HH-ZS]|uniref:peptidase domain-containing ABC transporter n=1 Tax=Alishewanella sp. HH-ZS TaxID=1856684 RepID=UPI0009F4F939|nr:peptidase domain-containing ABC transporter [Alishewanella sp. HH-ZS]
MSFLKFKRSKLPVITQTEASECGLACLTMIAVYYGHEVDLNFMRAKYHVSINGMSLERLIALADKMLLSARPLKVDLINIDKVKLPAILHWDLNHFVVLRKIENKKMIIHDPACGERSLSIDEFSESFTGIAIEIIPTENFNVIGDAKRRTISSFIGKVIGLKSAFFHTLVLSFALQLLILATPFYFQIVVDEVIVKNDLSLLVVLVVSFFLLHFFKFFTTILRSWIIIYYGNQLSYQLVTKLFRHLLYLPYSYFERRHVGDIISRLGSTEPIQRVITQDLVSVIIDGVIVSATIFILFAYSFKLGIVVVLSVALMSIISFLFYSGIKNSQHKLILDEAKKESFAIETIRSVLSLKLFSANANRISAWQNYLVNCINSRISLEKKQIFVASLHELISNIQLIIVIYFAANLILSDEDHFTVGMLFAFMIYRQHFTTSIMSLISKFIDFKLLSLHVDRISDLTDSLSNENPDKSVNDWIGEEQPAEIEFIDVHFRYSDNDPWVLVGATFKINRGDFVVFIGESGGGKSTLLKLVLGIYQPVKGKILIDGVPLTDLNRLEWRKRFSVVMQDDQLLSGTLADNISFFDQEMKMNNVIEAARSAYVHNTIMSMNMKYLSFIGDMGSSLSAGQKQRILLARALYRSSKTLILDEGTANLDENTEKLIVESVSKLSATRIIVAHRPEFISKANRKFKIHSGRVNEVTISD